MREGKVIVVGGQNAKIEPSVLRSIKGPLWGQSDGRFFLILVFSLAVHVSVLWMFSQIKLSTGKVMTIEQIPERFARLIIDRPIVKDVPKAADKQLSSEKEETAVEEDKVEKDDPKQQKTSEAKKNAAKQSVAMRAQKVEKKIRNVGVLGLLTGTGKTATGGSVVDVLGKIGDSKDNMGDLDKMLDDMSGLQKAPTMDVLDKKLVGSKEVALDYREGIDDLLADMSSVTTKKIAKQGDVIISRPESIEGAASSDAQRDNKVINKVVSSHRTSIRMSYERFLKRDPSLQGKITVRFTITANGSVTDVEIMENTTNNRGLENEIRRKVQMWKFASIPEGDVTVTFPFVFQPSSNR